MTPIINPWWFYIINLCARLHDFASIASIVGIFIIIILWMLVFFEVSCDEETEKILFEITKRLTICWIVSIILSIIIPSEEILYQMFAASMLTPDNISIVGETAAEVMTFITETISSMFTK